MTQHRKARILATGGAGLLLGLLPLTAAAQQQGGGVAPRPAAPAAAPAASAAAAEVDASSPSQLIESAANAMLKELDARRAEYRYRQARRTQSGRIAPVLCALFVVAAALPVVSFFA